MRRVIKGEGVLEARDGQKKSWDEADGAGRMDGWMWRRIEVEGGEGGICEISTSKGQSYRGDRLP